MKNTYKVTQVYASVSHYSYGKKLEANPINIVGLFEGETISEAIRIASQRSTVPQLCLFAELVAPSEGDFFIGQQVWERDTLAPGKIMDIDEDGIATVLFTNGNTDGVALEHLVSVVKKSR